MPVSITPSPSSSAEAIRFKRRDHPPAQSHLEAAALARPVAATATRRPWQPGLAALAEPLVYISPDAFHDILQASANPVVIRERRGWLFPREQFTTQYQGYYFTTRALQELRMPPGATVIFADRVEFR